VLAKFEPLIVTHDPASMPGRRLAPLSTEVITGSPGAASFITNALRYEKGSVNPPALGKSFDHVLFYENHVTLGIERCPEPPSSSVPPK
jgi:hypothetical protein